MPEVIPRFRALNLPLSRSRPLTFPWLMSSNLEENISLARSMTYFGKKFATRTCVMWCVSEFACVLSNLGNLSLTFALKFWGFPFSSLVWANCRNILEEKLVRVNLSGVCLLLKFACVLPSLIQKYSIDAWQLRKLLYSAFYITNRYMSALLYKFCRAKNYCRERESWSKVLSLTVSVSIRASLFEVEKNKKLGKFWIDLSAASSSEPCCYCSCNEKIIFPVELKLFQNFPAKTRKEKW